MTEVLKSISENLFLILEEYFSCRCSHSAVESYYNEVIGAGELMPNLYLIVHNKGICNVS